MPSYGVDPFQDIPAHWDQTINPFLKKLIDGQKDGSIPLRYGPELQKVRQNWRRYFLENEVKPEKLTLEIGSHLGKCLIEMAKNHPQHAFVGMDITMKRVVKTAQKAQMAQLTNVLAVLADAQFLSELFAEKELDGIIAFYPDPWTKHRSQLHRRLFKKSFICQISKILKEKGFFWFKTDSLSYFTSVEDAANCAGLKRSSRKDCYLKGDYQSIFESVFAQQAKACYEAIWIRE